MNFKFKPGDKIAHIDEPNRVREVVSIVGVDGIVYYTVKRGELINKSFPKDYIEDFYVLFNTKIKCKPGWF